MCARSEWIGETEMYERNSDDDMDTHAMSQPEMMWISQQVDCRDKT